MDQSATVARFGTADYVIFILVLLISAAIGVYYACTGGKQRTTSEFLLGNRKMNWIPVACSLLASFMSSVLILGTPGEIYLFGTTWTWLVASYPFALWTSTYVFIPVFHHLKITSVYEYLDRRFNRVVRILALVTYAFIMLLYMGINIYGPSLAMMQVTGLNLWISMLSVGIVCTFYTALGGIKAVLWTDTFQIIIMFSGLLAVIINGCLIAGGGSVIWESARTSGRLDFYEPAKLFDPDPRTRHTIWTQIIGMGITWTVIYGTNQAQVQRALSLPNMKSVRKAFWINVPGLMLLVSMSAFCGLIVYDHYKLCDPLKSKMATSRDQLFPLYVMETMEEKLPGLPGLIVACVFSASLSTVSSGVNALAAALLQDVVLVIKPDISDNRQTLISKLLTLVVGVITIILASISQYLGKSILPVVLTLFGLLGGPLLGLFSLGMFFPTANSYGAIVGLLTAIGLNLWIGMAQLFDRPYIYMYPTSIAGCNMTMNNFTDSDILSREYTYVPESYDLAAHHKEGIRGLYDISYNWLAPIGTIVVILVGLLVSLCTGNNKNRQIDRNLLTPFFHQWLFFLPNGIRDRLKFGIEPPLESEKNDASFANDVNLTREPTTPSDKLEPGWEKSPGCENEAYEQEQETKVV